MKSQSPTCQNWLDAFGYWRDNVAQLETFDATRETFWIVTLGRGRGFTGCYPVSSKAFGDAQRFADELFAHDCFREETREFVLIDNRPGASPKPTISDVSRVRAVIIAGRRRKCELLDCIVNGGFYPEFPLGIFCFRKLPGFTAAKPFIRACGKVESEAKS